MSIVLSEESTPSSPKTKRVHKPKKITMVFPYYLDAWLYTRTSGIKTYTITKTGSREFTLTFMR